MFLLCFLYCHYFKQKQIFVAPHRRIEEKEEQQHKMEKAFEDLYMTATGCFIVFTRAVPNRGSLLFDRIRIIKTIIRLNTNRIRIVATGIEL